MGKDVNPGSQFTEVRNAKYPMHFDDWKYYFQIQKPDPTNLAKHPIIELTSLMVYEPQRRYCRRVSQPQIALE